LILRGPAGPAGSRTGQKSAAFAELRSNRIAERKKSFRVNYGVTTQQTKTNTTRKSGEGIHKALTD
jgi:hypothetical protein